METTLHVMPWQWEFTSTSLGPTIMEQKFLATRIRLLIQDTVLLGCIAAIPAFLGYLLAGVSGVIFGAVFAVSFFAIVPALPPHVILRFHRGQPLPFKLAPELHYAVVELGKRAGLKKTPELYFIPSNSINAVSVGVQDESAIGLTLGIIESLSFEELLGVVAHEIGHIRNHDTRIMAITQIASLATEHLSFIGRILFLLSLPIIVFQSQSLYLLPVFAFFIFAPMLTNILSLALSRSREFKADLASAQLTHNPLLLASALERIESLHTGFMTQYFRIGNKPEANFLNSHPATRSRIEKLKAMRL